MYNGLAQTSQILSITLRDLRQEGQGERQGKAVTPATMRSKSPNQGTFLLELLQLYPCQGHRQWQKFSSQGNLALQD